MLQRASPMHAITVAPAIYWQSQSENGRQLLQLLGRCSQPMRNCCLSANSPHGRCSRRKSLAQDSGSTSQLHRSPSRKKHRANLPTNHANAPTITTATSDTLNCNSSRVISSRGLIFPILPPNRLRQRHTSFRVALLVLNPSVGKRRASGRATRIASNLPSTAEVLGATPLRFCSSVYSATRHWST